MAVVLAVLIFGFYSYLKGFDTAWKTTLGFLLGALCSGVAGYVGMFVSIRANLRTASAVRSSLNRALQIALRSFQVSATNVSIGTVIFECEGGPKISHRTLQIAQRSFDAAATCVRGSGPILPLGLLLRDVADQHDAGAGTGGD